MAFGIPLQSRYIRRFRLYLSVSYFGHNSKCGISRYAGKLMAAGSDFCDTRAMYTVELGDPRLSNGCRALINEENHIILKNWSLPSILCAKKLLGSRQSVAHFHYPPPRRSIAYLLAPFIFRLMGFQVFQTWHEELSRGGWVKALILRAAGAKIFVVKSDFVARSSILSRWVLKFFSIQLVPSLPLQIIKPKENKEIIDKFLKSEKSVGKNIFLVIGFLFPKRNIEIILDNLNKKTDILIIVGDYNVNYEYYIHLKNLICKKKLKNTVKFFGFIDSKFLENIFYYSKAIIFTNKGGVFNWNTSFLLSCYTGKPVVYFFNPLTGKPKVDGFTGTDRDFGISEQRSDMLRDVMILASETQPEIFEEFDINKMWKELFLAHNLPSEIVEG